MCEFLGIENNKSRLYIGNWGGNKEELQGRGKKIIAVAESIIKAINAVNELTLYEGAILFILGYMRICTLSIFLNY